MIIRLILIWEKQDRLKEYMISQLKLSKLILQDVVGLNRSFGPIFNLKRTMMGE
jgi:hypothetical protein